MIMLSIVSLFVGAALGQRFRVLVLMPATAILLVLAVGIGVAQAYTAWSVILMVAATTASMQIGYLIGIGIRHALAAVWSSGSSPLAAPTPSTPAR
jgi:hypothetical protein